MRNLRNFRFSCFDPTAILHILTLLPASDYETIELSFLAQDEQNVPWPAIDVALAEPRFRGLRRFSSSYIGAPAGEKLAIEDLLPLAQARGILE
jgi:hypothetical protein